MKALYTRTHASTRGDSTYRAEGVAGVLYLPKSAFNGNHPETIEVDGIPDDASSMTEAKPKETKEERKARLAARTPTQIAADAQKVADRAIARAKKLAEKASA